MTGKVVSLRPSGSRPTVGIAQLSFETRNQKGEVVMTMLNAIMFERREAAAGAQA